VILSIDDLFAAGLGLDVAGAYLLGKGLLTSPQAIIKRATPYYDFSYPVALAQAEDRVDAVAGIAVLLTGFALQALAYTLSIGFALHAGTGWVRAITALAAAVVAGAVALVAAHQTRWRRLAAQVVDLARHDKVGQRHDEPSARRLQSYGFELGISAAEKEILPGGAPLYCRRVFHVERTRDDPMELLETT
jgi:hypothetical protein